MSSMKIPDGDPIPMPMPGELVTFKKGGKLYTDTVTAVTYHSATPAIWPKLSRWQRTVRKLTPRRWRNPLEPVREARPATVTVQAGDAGEQVARTQRNLQQVGEFIDGLTHRRT